jgi:hypothetical protein
VAAVLAAAGVIVWIVQDRFGYVMRVFDGEAPAEEYAKLHGFTVEAVVVCRSADALNAQHVA